MFCCPVTIDKGGTLFSTIELRYYFKLFTVVFSIVEIAKFFIVIIRVWSWVDGKPN